MPQPGTTSHTTSLRRSWSDRLGEYGFRFTCTCGTRGQVRPDEYDAQRLADQHITNQRSGRPTIRRALPRTQAPADPFDRPFGVEIEFIGSMPQVAAAMTAVGLNCELRSYDHTTSRTAWKVVPDGSVWQGGELVSPVLVGENGREQIRQACQALRDAGATFNRSTGLHVHHQATDLTERAFGRLFRFWYNGQDAIDELVSRSRRDGANTFCRRLSGAEVTELESLSNLNRSYLRSTLRGDSDRRYRTLNVMAYLKYGTIEVRQHQGTGNAEKILNWVAFGQAMFAWAAGDRSMPVISTLTSLLAELREAGLADEAATYLAGRAVELATESMRAA